MRILISGPPASGKSSLARRLAEDCGAEVIDFDEIARSLGSDSHHDHPSDIRRATRSIIESRIDNLTGSAVVIQSAPVAADRRHLAQRIGADRVLVLAVPPAEAKARAEADGRPGWTSDAIDRWWSRYLPDSTDEVISGPETGPANQRRSGEMPDAPTPKPGSPAEPATPPAGTQPDTPAAKGGVSQPATPATQPTEPVQLPDDHPLVKAYAATKAKLKEHDDAQLSEMEKLTNTVGEQTTRAETAEARVALLEAAIAHGLSMDDLALLGSGSPDEIAKRAEALAKRLGAAPSASGKPVTALGQQTEPPADPDAWLRGMAHN